MTGDGDDVSTTMIGCQAGMSGQVRMMMSRCARCDGMTGSATVQVVSVTMMSCGRAGAGARVDR